MKCIYCDNNETSVINTRMNRPGIVWRRRQCERCAAKFTTEETPRGNNLFITKRNGKRKRFVYEKLFTSLVFAMEGGKGNDRGDNALTSKKVANEIITHLTSMGRTEITSALLITLVYEQLMRTNEHAAERYMHYSLYREQTLAPVRRKRK